MPAEEPRRFLIATAVAHNRLTPTGNRPGLKQARQAIIDLFTRQLGYVHVTDLGLDPDRATLLEFLDRFASDVDRRPDDVVAVYLAGHGVLHGATPRRHVFFPTDADLTKPNQALATRDIAAALTDNTKIANLLLMLDTCHSGQGGADAVAACVESLCRDLDGGQSGVVVMMSAQPAQQARVAAFPELLVEAVHALAAEGVDLSALDLGALVAHMNANPGRPAAQRFEWQAAKLVGEVPTFFPHPRANAHDSAVLRGHAGGDRVPLLRLTRTTSRDGSRTERLEILDPRLAREMLQSYLQEDVDVTESGDD